VFGVFDHHKLEILTSQQRDFSKTGVIPSRPEPDLGHHLPGQLLRPDLGSTGNPALPPAATRRTRCRAPATAPAARTTPQIDDLPEQKQTSFFGKATFKLNGDHLATSNTCTRKTTWCRTPRRRRRPA
jgi:iron complex outermembrane receptor protein